MNDDLISRQVAIDSIKYAGKIGKLTCMAILKRLPPAEPETAKRIVGRTRLGMIMWFQCEMCNSPVDEHDTYCCGCGRRLIDG